jgi:hypothetical protein
MVSVDNPSVEYEVVSYDKDAERIVLRGVYGDYDLPYVNTEKRKLNWRLETRTGEDDAH